MKILLKYILYVLCLMVWINILQSCTHDLTIDIEPESNPMDAPLDDPADPIDTMMTELPNVDPIPMGTPCDPQVVYFEKDILPIFIGSCAYSGCHDAATAKDGVVLDNYDNIIETGDVRAFDLDGSDIYEVITEEDPDDIMPPAGKLANVQIELIASWILQGAENLDCDQEEGPCVTEDVSYSGTVAGIMQTHCNGCHASGVALAGIITDNYVSVESIVNNGRLEGAINWEAGFENMPQGQDQLEQCNIDKIKSWIDAGAKND